MGWIPDRLLLDKAAKNQTLKVRNLGGEGRHFARALCSNNTLCFCHAMRTGVPNRALLAFFAATPNVEGGNAI